MELTHPFQENLDCLKQDANSRFLVVKSNDVQQIELLSTMFPRLSSMIKNNRNKNLLLNFRDEKHRSLIVMVVSQTTSAAETVSMAMF